MSLSDIFLNPHMERLPEIGPNYNINRAGVYIIGDLAGAPVLKMAINQGAEVMEHLLSLPDIKGDDKEVYDLVICGAGPSGLSVGLKAREAGLNFLILEKAKFANTITEYPEQKHIYVEPKDLPKKGDLWLEECEKERMLDEWQKQAGDLPIKTGEEITELIDRIDGAIEVHTLGGVYPARRVILALGKRGNPRQLGVPGEELEKVKHNLLSPRAYQDRDILIVGGGDSAVEAALALYEKNRVTISYRRKDFFRLKKQNMALIKEAIAEDRITPFFSSQLKEIKETTVTIEVKDKDEVVLKNDLSFVMIGAEPPTKLLDRIGVKMENTWSTARWIALPLTLLFFWIIYTTKGEKDVVGRFLAPYFNFGGKSLGFWWSGLYSVVVTGFGLKAIGKYKDSAYQFWRYLSLIFCQVFFFFLLPEFLVKYLPFAQATGWQDWRAYSFLYVWPLNFSAFLWSPPAFMIYYSAFLAFVAMPIFVYFHGKRYCAWICGCGGLAETLGDKYRTIGPRGETAFKMEDWNIYPVLFWVVILTLVGYFAGGSRLFGYLAEPYMYIVDMLLAGVMGVGLYFFLGNRVWCRYWCPLARYMELLSGWFSKFKITSNDKCIGCAKCTRQCQMGIDVMKYALTGKTLDNKSSSCIGCGICVDVCPMQCLKFGE